MHIKTQGPATIMSINMLLKQTRCIICLPSFALFITRCGSENDRERFKHALLCLLNCAAHPRPSKPGVHTQIPAVQTGLPSLCFFNVSLGVKIKHIAGKTTPLSPSSSDLHSLSPSQCMRRRRSGRKRPPPSRKQPDPQSGCSQHGISLPESPSR